MNDWERLENQYHQLVLQHTFMQMECLTRESNDSLMNLCTTMLNFIRRFEGQAQAVTKADELNIMKKNVYLFRGQAKKYLRDDGYVVDFQFVLIFDPNNAEAQAEVINFGQPRSCCMIG